MNIKQLINLLSQLPDDTEVEVYHNQYCGGGDEERFDEPAVRIDTNLRVVYILPDTIAYQLKNHTCLIEDLL